MLCSVTLFMLCSVTLFTPHITPTSSRFHLVDQQFLCSTARSASGGVSATVCLAYAVLPDSLPSFLSPPANASFVIGRRQSVRVDVSDSNLQHIVSVSVVGVHLLQVSLRLLPQNSTPRVT
jgi:hypothetical protein